VRTRAEDVWLAIRDDGLGFDPELAESSGAGGESLGLRGMKERASLLGGRLEVRSSPGAGTEVEAWFPLPSDAASDGSQRAPEHQQ
jgi:signal transduction histidine kinase